jgi:archaellum component FlaF (FlaF/FlaG flagellin family)
LARLQEALLAATLVAATLGLCAPSSAQFETRGTHDLRVRSFSAAVGDFNHDGKLDLAVALFDSGQVAVLLGNGDGTFRPATYYTIGGSPESIIAADFAHDGNLDLAVASNSNYLSILTGNGDGTFRVGTVSVSAFPSLVAAGDFNGDGKADLVASDNSNPCRCLMVLLGNGDGSFQAPVYTYPAKPLLTLGVGDFNSDGKSDLATAGTFGASNYVNILLSNGDGSFRQGASYSAEPTPESMAVADFAGDGELDVAIGDFSDIGVSVLIGNGNGTFQASTNYPTSYPTAVAVADFNGDDKLDLAVSNFGAPGGTVSVLLGNGDGTFQPGVSYPAGNEMSFVAAGDFNGDQKPDLVLLDSGLDDVVVLLNTGVVSFSPTGPLTFPAQFIETVSAPRTVTLTNTGATELTISSLTVTGPFRVSSECGKVVAAGASCNINAIFQPPAAGPASGLISIMDSASTRPQVIELSGQGTVVKLSPRKLNFAAQEVGTESAPQPVQLTNEGSTSLSVTTIKIRGTNGTDFSETDTCGSPVAPGASCTISVTFAPKKAGSRSAKIYITDTGGGSPQTVPLTGTGD